MNSDTKKQIEAQYWQSIEAETMQDWENQDAMAAGDYCFVYAKKQCIGCPDFEKCKAISNS